MKKRIMKKLVGVVLTAALIGTMAACGSSKAEDAAEDTAEAVEAEAEEAAEPAAEEDAPAAEEPAAEEPAAEEPAAEAAAPAAEPVTLNVFAAASMTETLEKIAEMYKEVAPNVELVFNFDSSGTLVTQIEEGAECDLFISAAQKQMNAIDGTQDAEANPDGFDLIVNESREDILENKVTLVVPADNPKGVEGFEDLAEKLKNGEVLMAMGNEDVPVGQYTQKILDFYGLSEEELANAGNITYGSNVKEVTTQVSEASVDCGVIYCTDAFSAGLTIVDEATAEMCGQVIYPAAVLKASANQEAAQAFLDYLTTPDAMAVFEEVGFSPVA